MKVQKSSEYMLNKDLDPAVCRTIKMVGAVIFDSTAPVCGEKGTGLQPLSLKELIGTTDGFSGGSRD